MGRDLVILTDDEEVVNVAIRQDRTWVPMLKHFMGKYANEGERLSWVVYTLGTQEFKTDFSRWVSVLECCQRKSVAEGRRGGEKGRREKTRSEGGEGKGRGLGKGGKEGRRTVPE